jgi:hypothetical protein
MRFKLIILMVLGALWSRAAMAASFTASLDPDTVTLGEQSTLSLTFEGGQSKNVPTPDVPGLQFVNTGNAQSFSLINGAMSSTVTVTFSVTPQHDGDFVIPALTADVNGQALSTAPLKLTVLKAAAPSTAALEAGDQVAFMKLLVPQNRVYVGQSFVAQIQVFLRDDVQNFANFQFTSTAADGLSLGKMASGQRGQSRIGNHDYTVIPISVALTTVKPGQLTLGPFTAGAVIVLPSPNDGGNGNPFFRQFFNQGEQKQVSLATDQIRVESLPLPAEGVPPGFNGALGDFSMSVTAGPTNVAAGDPITVRVQISGRGAFDAVKLPDQLGGNNFKSFPPTVKTETTDQFGLVGTKTFEQILAPQNSDVRELPAFTFAYFNPVDGTYHTLNQPALPLTVRAAGATPLPALAPGNRPGPDNAGPQDILPIQENPGPLKPERPPLLARPAFLVTQGVPVLAFLAALIWRRRTDHLAHNPRRRRQLAVAQLVRDGLKNLKTFAAENQPDPFFALLFRLLQEQVGERLDCPATAITENVIDEHPVLRGVSPATREALRDLFQLCNQARYAPVRGSGELNSVAAKFEQTARELQALKA